MAQRKTKAISCCHLLNVGFTAISLDALLLVTFSTTHSYGSALSA
jgi:hypothetical protein